LQCGAFWNGSYTWIYQANACIEGISKSEGISTPCKNQLIGEAKFIRAFLYFNLVNLYGDVPLVTSTNYAVNASLPRTSVAQVFQQIVQDLKDAQQLLTASYPSAGKVRPNKFAATALLARAYLYQKQWANAAAAANEVISTGSYGLVTDLD